MSDPAQEHILAGDPPVVVRLRRSAQARRYSLRVSRLDGQVTLTLPARASRAKGIAFVEQKAAWIRQRLADRPEEVAVVEGASIPLRGRPFRIAPGLRSAVLNDDGVIEVSARVKSVPRAVRTLLMAEARADLERDCAAFAGRLGAAYSRIDLRDTRSRWGSCSAQGRLMFSWRLVLAPPEILSYVAAHEVAHLVHMDHSAAFWRAVARLWPEYQSHRRWLRQNGDLLHRYRFDH